jgi:hypothetical protein
MSEACKDCPRRGKAMAFLEEQMEVVEMAKSKCVHPQRPMSEACKDCPRRGKAMAFLEEQVSPSGSESLH